MALFRNESSSKSIRIKHLSIALDASSASRWLLYINPTVTTLGVAQPIRNLVGAVTSPEAVLYDAPTISVLGTALEFFMLTGTIRGAELAEHLHLTLLPGESILIRRENTGSGNQVGIHFDWVED